MNHRNDNIIDEIHVMLLRFEQFQDTEAAIRVCQLINQHKLYFSRTPPVKEEIVSKSWSKK